MGTRTAPRKKTKRLQRKKQQSQRRFAPNKIEKQVESATFGEEGSSRTSPIISPAETAQAWARENEASSTIKQVAAAALIYGQKVSQTASALGVDRRTIQRWQKLDPEFQLAMVEIRQEVVLSSRQYLLALAEGAVDVVETKLSEEQNAQVALSLLRGIGVLAPQSVEAKLREDVKSAKEFCAQTATLDATEQGCHASRLRGHADVDTDIEFRAQTATLAENVSDSPGSENEFCAQTATSGESGSNESALPGDEDNFSTGLESLPPTQQLAIEAFYEGKSLAEVALSTKTSEATLRGWLCGDRPFFEALSGLQFDRIYHLKYRLLSLVKHAMQIIQKAISEGNGRVALSLLCGFGVMR